MRLEKLLEYRVLQMFYNANIAYIASTIAGTAIAALSPIIKTPYAELLGPAVLVLGLLLHITRVRVAVKYLEALSRRPGLAYVDVNLVSERKAHRVFLSLGPSYAPNIVDNDVDPGYVAALVYVKPVIARLRHIRTLMMVQGSVIGGLAGIVLAMLGDSALAITVPLVQVISLIIVAKSFKLGR